MKHVQNGRRSNPCQKAHGTAAHTGPSHSVSMAALHGQGAQSSSSPASVSRTKHTRNLMMFSETSQSVPKASSRGQGSGIPGQVVQGRWCSSQIHMHVSDTRTALDTLNVRCFRPRTDSSFPRPPHSFCSSSPCLHLRTDDTNSLTHARDALVKRRVHCPQIHTKAKRRYFVPTWQ